MTIANPEDTTVESFTDHAHSEVLQSGDEGYNEVRTVWNGIIDKEPAIIFRCTGAADVITAVNFARVLDLLLAVKGGGHKS